MLDLLHPMYQATASYGHFGRKAKEIVLPSGEKFTTFSWEKTDRAEALRKDALVKAIMPGFAQRCGADCVANWNATIGKSLGLKMGQ